MQKQIFYGLKKFSYEPEHRYAPYTFDGVHYMTAGDMNECQYKHCLGYAAKKDGNTTFDKGSDIPELNRSVKSSRATLTSKPIGHDFESIFASYFATVPSTSWAWIVMVDDTLIAYIMNADEFGTLLRKFAKYQADRNVIRFGQADGKIVKYLESVVEG